MPATNAERAQAAHDIACLLVDALPENHSFEPKSSLDGALEVEWEPFELDFSPWKDDGAQPMHVKLMSLPAVAKMMHLSLERAGIPHRIVEHHANGMQKIRGEHKAQNLPQADLDCGLELVVAAAPGLADIASSLPIVDGKLEPAYHRVDESRKRALAYWDQD